METCWPVEKVQEMSRAVTSDRSHPQCVEVAQIQVPPQESKAEVCVTLQRALGSAPCIGI